MTLSGVTAGSYVQANDVAAIMNCVGNNDGVIIGMAVSEKGAGANMSVDVALGGAMANDTHVSKTTTTNVAIDASDATKDRIDLVTVDAAGTIAITKGTNYNPATEAVVPPATPANKTLLAYVYVTHGATTITNSNVTDARQMTRQWRLLYASNGGAATDDFAYKANMAANKVLVIASVYNTLATPAGNNDRSTTTYDYIKVDTIAVKTQSSYIRTYVQSSPANISMSCYYNASLNCVLMSSEMTLTADHTIQVAADATVNSVFIFAK